MSLLDSSGLGTVLEFAIGELRRPPTAWASVDPWWEEFRRRRQDWAMPIDQAVLGGVLADRVGYAFAAGYQAALLRLDPGLPADRIVSLSVTEEGGGHPQAIESTLTADGSGGFVLDGRKKWATMSSSGGLALVAAKTGIDDQGRNRLRVARVDLAAAGVTIEPMPATEFVPEIRHCRLVFAGVHVASEDLLPGDGYTGCVKPFRTLEDIYVSTAVLTYLLGISLRCVWPREISEQILALLVSLRGLGLADPRSAAVHVALEGVLKWRQKLIESIVPHWDSVEPVERARWVRDQPLTSIAGRVRGMRTDTAWKKLG
jgi:hypothetical protein